MLQKNKLLRALLAAGLTTGMVACGGGGSSSDSTSGGGGGGTPPSGQGAGAESASRGQFVDSPVGGLEYETSSGMSGLTTDDGFFNYKTGDEVTFKLGSFYIGKTTGSNVVTPFSLTSGNEEQATNVARFLQTLDDDGIPGNGITITDNTRLEAKKQNATDVATANLDDSTIAATITNLTAKNSAPQSSVVSPEDALEHLNGTINTMQPIVSCGENTHIPTAEDIAGNSFGFIAEDELIVFHFDQNGMFAEYQYDEANNGRIKDGDTGSWEISGSTLTFYGEESFNVCATDHSLLLESGDETSILFNVKSFEVPNTDQSYLLSYMTGAQAILTVKNNGGLDYFPAETPISENAQAIVNNETKALDLDFDEGGVIDSVYFLASQGKRTGIYLDYNEERQLSRLATVTAIANPQPVSAETFNNKVFVDRIDEANETVIYVYNSDGTLEEFHNACGSKDKQSACYEKGTWSFNEETHTLTVDSYYNFKAVKSGAYLYLSHVEVAREELNKMRKTQAIAPEAFPGRYTVDIPTENTRFNTLTINENGSCTYDKSACNWAVKDSGKAEITFGSGGTTRGNIWQLAGSSNKFAFVMTHEDKNDIEPGMMTRD